MTSGIRYKHTNIVAGDWKKLADFYQSVFKCEPVPPERHLTGDWLSQGTGVQNASFSGIHMRLPGHGNNGPTLEIFQYKENESRPPVEPANREGLSHLAFEVEDIDTVLERMIRHGGATLGSIVSKDISGVGRLSFVYARIPKETSSNFSTGIDDWQIISLINPKSNVTVHSA